MFIPIAFSQTQDGGYEYREIEMASNVIARIRCNYTYNDRQDGQID